MIDNEKENKNMTVWPPYEELDCYILPEYISSAVAQIADKIGHQINSISYNVWGESVHNDNYSVQQHAEMYFAWKDNKEKPSEDELDHIPSVRKLERTADFTWDVLPIDTDLEGHINGEVSFFINEKGVTFSNERIDYDDEISFEAKAFYQNERWHYYERLIIRTDEFSETDIAISDAGELLSSLDAESYGFEKWPEDKTKISLEIDENDDFCFTVENGGFFENYIRENV